MIYTCPSRNRLVFFLFALSTFIFSCSKDKESDLFRLSLDKTNLRIDTATGSAESVTLDARVPWTAEVTVGAAWLQIDKASGGLGKTVIRVSYRPGNVSAIGQTGTVTFHPTSGSARSVTLSVNLKPYSFSLTTSKVIVATEANGPRAVASPDGGLVFVTSKSSAGGGHGKTEAWIVKLNAAGDTVWTRTMGGQEDDVAARIAVTSDGNYIIVGSTQSSDGDVTDKRPTFGQDMWVIKLDGNGHTIWTKTFGGGAGDEGTAVVVTPDGGCLVAGATESNNGEIVGNHGSSDAWVVKLDKQGKAEWSKVYGGSGFDEITQITATPEGYVLAGLTDSPDGDVKGFHVPIFIGADFLVIRIDLTGNLVWAKAYGGTGDEVATSIVAAPDGVVVAGYANSTDGDVVGLHGSLIAAFIDMWVLKLDKTGSIVWAKMLGGRFMDAATAVAATPDGGFVLAGSTDSDNGDVIGNHNTNSSGDDYWVVKLDAGGNKEWTKTMGGTGDDAAYSILVNPDGYTVLGSSTSTDGDVRGPSATSYNVWVTRLIVH